jgi:hypothetical protein
MSIASVSEVIFFVVTKVYAEMTPQLAHSLPCDYLGLAESNWRRGLQWPKTKSALIRPANARREKEAITAAPIAKEPGTHPTFNAIAAIQAVPRPVSCESESPELPPYTPKINPQLGTSLAVERVVDRLPGLSAAGTNLIGQPTDVEVRGTSMESCA